MFESLVAQAATNDLMGSLGMFIPLILMFVAMYFLMIRPQKKRQKDLTHSLVSLTYRLHQPQLWAIALHTF